MPDLGRTLRAMLAPATRCLMLSGVLLLPAGGALAQEETQTFKPALGQAGRDVIWLPTPNELIKALLSVAKVSPQDTVVDLGSGDGKIVIAAARDFGAKARGVEFDPRMVALSEQRAEEAGVAERTRFVEADIFKHDFSDATVVTMYLLPELNLRLRPTLMAMKPGTRVLTHFFDMGRWRADETLEASSRPGYMWIVPANAGGIWKASYRLNDVPTETTITIDQSFQDVRLRSNAESSTIAANRDQANAQSPADGIVEGDTIRFTLKEANGKALKVDGTLSANRLTGTISQGTHTAPFIAERQGTAPAIDGSGEPTEKELNAARLALGTE